MNLRLSLPLKLLALALLLICTRQSLAADSKDLLNAAADGAEKQFTPTPGTGDQVTMTKGDNGGKPCIVMSIKPGASDYPGVSIKPDSGVWDLSAYGHVEARVTNTGTKEGGLAVRVDNNGDWSAGSPTNAEQVYLKPGETGTVTVIFGYAYGHKPSFALNPAAVPEILLFAMKSDVPQSFRIETLEAAGPAGEKPPVDPASIRVTPKDGVVFDGNSQIDAGKQIQATGGVQATFAAGSGLRVVFAGNQDNQTVSLRPPIGKWDLREASEILVKVKNEGQTPITPHIRAVSEWTSTEENAPEKLAPGDEKEIAVSFIPTKTWQAIPNSGDRTEWNGVAGTGTQFNSDAATAVRISADKTDAGTILVESIVADAPAAQVPDWIGKRPPVDGEWTQTFDDEFDGKTLDTTKWDVTGPNYYDQVSHWTKDNVIVGDGVVMLRYEKKTGYQNDDPKGKQTPYASGYLATYGKWVQRYGYFEARMKLPTAPGLWPAFWMMPDRGVAVGEQWKRQSTEDHGMEFDIMEHLDRWGPHRYNNAEHWDGYEKNHKQNGNGWVYSTPDKDGFITCGLLWTPGEIIYYCNGKEVGRWDDPRVSNVQADIMFTLPSGGWDNDPLNDAKLPDDFTIDYVRAWQRKDLASAVDGPQNAK